jgi:hypothetical protein
MFCSNCGLKAEAGKFCFSCGSSLERTDANTMPPPEQTTFDNKVAILSDLWMIHRHDEEFADFFDYNDISMPLAYMIEAKLVSSTALADVFINQTWNLLLDALEIQADEGFETLEQVLALKAVKLHGLEQNFSKSSNFENFASNARADSWCVAWLENRLTDEALLSNLTEFIRKFDLDGTPGYQFQSLRIILKYSNSNVLWATPEDGWFLSHQTLEVSPGLQELLTGNQGLPKFDWSVEANGFRIPEQIIADTIRNLSNNFGPPTLLLPFSNLEHVDEEDFVADWQLDEETEVDEDLLGAINKFIEIEFLKSGDLDKISSPWRVQVVDSESEWPEHSYPAKFAAFLDEIRRKPDWVVVLDECCRGCAESTEQNIRMDPQHGQSEIFFTWEQTIGVSPSGKIFQGHTSESREAIDFLAELATKHSLPARISERPEGNAWTIDIGNF